MITFNDGELERLEAAVRLRAEACEENDSAEDRAEARHWRRLLDKLQTIQGRSKFWGLKGDTETIDADRWLKQATSERLSPRNPVAQVWVNRFVAAVTSARNQLVAERSAFRQLARQVVALNLDTPLGRELHRSAARVLKTHGGEG